MTTDDDRLTEKEIKRLLTLAMAQKRDSGRMSLGELKAGAGELGVGADKLDEAYKILRTEQATDKIRRRRLARAFALWFVLIVAVVGIWRVFAVDRPPEPFAGSVHATLTSALKDDLPVDSLTTVRVFTHRSFFIHASFSGLKRPHATRAILTDATGLIVESDSVNMTSTSEPYYVWYRIHMPWNRAPGRYEADVLVDDKSVAKLPVTIELGPSTVLMSGAVDTTNAVPTDLKDKFDLKRDKNIWVVARMEALEGKGATVRFLWTAPDGSSFRDVPLVLAEAHGAYSVYDYLPIAKFTAGRWKTRVEFEGTSLGEAVFDVE